MHFSFCSTESAIDTIAMGVMIALLSVVLLAVCIMFLLFCTYHYVSSKKVQQKDTEYNCYMMQCPEPTYENAVRIPEPVYVNTADHNHDQ
jgi:hypothetical protein